MAKPAHVYLISALRKIWRWSPQRREAIKKATKGKYVECAACKELLSASSPRGQRKPYTVDHISPIVRPGKGHSPTIPKQAGQMSWDEYIDRMMFGELQILCHPCHKAKTKEENNARKKSRK